jgi:hypothetical protein
MRTEPIFDYLGEKEFIVGELTWIDFYWLELTECGNYFSEGRLFETYPNAKAYVERMRALKGLKNYTGGVSLYNNKIAKVNNKPELIYFGGYGRAEPIRMLLAHAQVKYDDVRITFEQFAEMKSSLPSG